MLAKSLGERIAVNKKESMTLSSFHLPTPVFEPSHWRLKVVFI